jgi:uncharacterized protein YoxC
MSIEERLEFLLQSTESLHASVQELHASVQELHASVQELHEVAQEHTKQLEIDAENIRRLASIAAAHEERLDDVEGRG